MESKSVREKASTFVLQYAFERTLEQEIQKLLQLAARLELGLSATTEELAPIQDRLFQDLYKGIVASSPTTYEAQFTGFLALLTEDLPGA